MSDPRSLLALLTVSSVTSRIDLAPMAERVEEMLASVPRTRFAAL